MSLLNAKKIILGVTSSVAAYKAVEIARLLLKQGAEVRVIITQGGTQFITPLTFQAIVGNVVFTDLFQPLHAAMEHIDLARWANAILIAPASASCIARLAHGLADDLLSTTCLAAAEKLIFIAPAMNEQMWHHPITQENLKKLQQLNHNVRLLGPASGEQACGDVGLGRMLAPEEILAELAKKISNKFAGTRVLITAGPTREAIDDVRFISNHSSGKMGYALAEAFRNQGAHVTLISGPCAIVPPPVQQFISVTSAEEMFAAVMQVVNDCAIFVATAAVADFKPAKPQSGKIKKSAALTVPLVNNPDILQAVGLLEKPIFKVGFALESENLLKNAEQKLINKKADMIIANSLADGHNPFYADENRVLVFRHNYVTLQLAKTPKPQLAEQLCDIIFETLF